MNTMTTSRLSEIHAMLTNLLSELEQSKDRDDQSIQAMKDLLRKQASDELTIAFCGHFSAGKSSLINKLCGKKVLPSSPVPTSANVVALRNGSPRALLTPVKGTEQSQIELPDLVVPLEQLDEHCRNGNEFSLVSVWDEIPMLGKHGVLLDTPGVDSNDAAHALATDSALHLADLVFYVMDYNHVQSESNLSFAKTLAERGKPLYMIVNQIDKHRESELSFEQYRTAVEQAFNVWQVQPAGIFYLSLREPTHPHNMLLSLENLINDLLNQRSSISEYSVVRSAYDVAESYLRRMDSIEASEQETLLAEVGGEEALAVLESEIIKLEKQMEDNEALPEHLLSKLASELDHLLSNAHLMTPPLRDAATQYLESRQSGFKTGLLFSGNKTEREKQRRKDDFLHKLQEQVSAQVDWHVRDLLRRLGQSQELWTPEWEQQLDACLPRADESWIAGAVREGAVISGTATLHYAAEVSAGIAARYRSNALALADALLAELAPRVEQTRQRLTAQRAELLSRSAAAVALRGLRHAQAERAARLHALLGARPTLTPGILPEVSAQPLLPPQAQQQPPAPAAAQELRHAQPSLPVSGRGTAAPQGLRRLSIAAALLEAAADEVAPHAALSAAAVSLRERAAALRRGRFTVALFGAFSAGKSSFANALLGASVLPVSPHPTTAAINRIMAPDDEHQHGTAVVSMKSLDAMYEDLAHSFAALQLGAWSEEGWMQAAERLQVQDVQPAGRPHYSFLKSAAAGWGHNGPRLGSQLKVDLEQYASFVADESQACFVAQIDLYYSCELTEQGIVLVDTPGADSIHARHTGVTFEYMKNSDALLYVTYYNHAFSRADRQFLAQLGRVKGSFALDKMFFLVNAADLAWDEEELAEVVSHVNAGLRGAGIGQPQIYAVSSMKALEAKLACDSQALVTSGFTAFENRFATFMEQDLAGLALQTAATELQQLTKRAEQWVHTWTQSEGERERQLEQMKVDQVLFHSELHRLTACDLRPEIAQECEELLYHVRQRIRFLSGDLYHEFFHPSLLSDDGGDLKRKFAASLHGWTSQLSKELERELQATSLRIEKLSGRLLARETTKWISEISDRLQGPLMFPAKFDENWETPPIPEDLLGNTFKPQSYWSYFKHPKSFFESGGKNTLREALDLPLAELIKQAVDRVQEEFIHYYKLETSRRFAIESTRLAEEWKHWETGITDISLLEVENTSWRELPGRLAYIESQVQQIK